MAENNNTDKGKSKTNLPKMKNKGKFNFYWIYAIMFFIILIVYITGFNDGATKTDWPQLMEMLKKQHVSKIVVVNKDEAEIYIKEDILKEDPAYKDVRSGSGITGAGGPQYYMNISSAENFENKLTEVQQGLSEVVYPEFENRTSWTDSLSWLLPIIILVVVYQVCVDDMLNWFNWMCGCDTAESSNGQSEIEEAEENFNGALQSLYSNDGIQDIHLTVNNQGINYEYNRCCKKNG